MSLSLRPPMRFSNVTTNLKTRWSKRYLLPKTVLTLDQVKVLFPEIDRDQLGKADAMLMVEGDKLVSSAAGQIVQDTPNVEASPKASPDEESSAAE
ncbi:hypothetical protein QL285_080727 [Trifolium repens]|nr:hypothetical protein QL285_080727 [Trifolium repens]